MDTVEFVLKLTKEDLVIINDALCKEPYSVVVLLIAKINSQLKGQVSKDNLGGGEQCTE